MRYVICFKTEKYEYVYAWCGHLYLQQLETAANIMIFDNLSTAQDILGVISKHIKVSDNYPRLYFKKVDSLDFPYKITETRKENVSISNYRAKIFTSKSMQRKVVMSKNRNIDKEIANKTFKEVNKIYKKAKTVSSKNIKN